MAGGGEAAREKQPVSSKGKLPEPEEAHLGYCLPSWVSLRGWRSRWREMPAHHMQFCSAVSSLKTLFAVSISPISPQQHSKSSHKHVPCSPLIFNKPIHHFLLTQRSSGNDYNPWWPYGVKFADTPGAQRM